MTTYAAEAGAMAVAAANLAFTPRQRLTAILTAAHRVDAAPTVMELINFMTLLLRAPPAPPVVAPIGGGPAPVVPPPVAALVPTPAQTAALTTLVGPIGGVGGIAGWFPHDASFFSGAGALRFRNFNRRLIAFQLIIRVADPKYIDQGTHPLCGPVVLMEAFARNYPAEYVAYVIGMALNGAGMVRFAGGAKVISLQADSNIFGKHSNHAHIPEADYIALASLRDQGHWLIHTPYRSSFTNRMIEGATTAGTLMRWMTDGGYANVEDLTLTRMRNAATKLMFFSTGVRDSVGESLMRANLNTAINRMALGRSVFMAVAGNLAHYALNRQGHRDAMYMTAFGGHWVTLLNVNFVAAVAPGAGVAANRGGVQFEIRTWTEETDAANLVTVPWSKVGNWYRGFVSGTP